MRMRIAVLSLSPAVLLTFLACALEDRPFEAAHLRYYGFAVVDCGWDDPGDSQAKTNYTDEIAGFSNVAHLCVYDPSDWIGERLDLMTSFGVKSILAIQNILFEVVPDPSRPSGERLALRPDFTARWAAFVGLNASRLDETHVQAFYLVDEPYWNGCSFSELTSAADLVQATHPEIATLLVEAYTALDLLELPHSIDWIAFDEYGIIDPAHDPGYLANLAKLRSKKSDTGQLVAIIMEAQWYPFYGDAGVSQEEMALVARNYETLAWREPDVVALIGYLWPGGLDRDDQMGARNLPLSVRGAYAAIGRKITRK